jgi:hypothetical protein
MFSRFKNNSIFKNPILVLSVLFIKLHSQELNNQYILELNKISSQPWSLYNNYGQELSEIQFHYKASFKHKKADFNLKLFASKNKIYIGESFYKSKLFNNTYLKVGHYYKDFSSYLNDNLSSGSLLISNNAEPMPKIGLLSSYKFKQNENLDFNFGISHGLFSKSEIYKSAPMLHEKFIYLNYSKNQNKFGVGFVHNAMWGGSTEDYGDFPNTFKDFLKVFISADGPLLEGEPHANALGNHLGIWDFYYKRKVDKKELKLYYQHFFEDTSGLRFDNKSDGLWGLELYNYIINTNILFEYLNTTNQDRDPPYVEDYYYHHYQYPAGWSYKGYVIGNPFINAGNYSNINPSKVFHIGIGNHKMREYNYRLLFSRKTNISDPIKYKIVFGKMINNLEVDLFIVGEESQKNSLGIKLSYFL